MKPRESLPRIFPGGHITYLDETGDYFLVHVPGRGYWMGWSNLPDSLECKVVCLKPMTASRGEHVETMDSGIAENLCYKRSGELLRDARSSLGGNMSSWDQVMRTLIKELE